MTADAGIPIRDRSLWSILLPCVARGFVRNPRLALRLLPKLDPFHRKSLRCFSLQIFGGDFIADLYAASAEAGVRPFLMWGTLLGCIREGGLLKHDQDIDIGILPVDYLRKDALFAAMRKRGYIVEFDVSYKFRFTRPGFVLHMDVDIFYPWNGSMICSLVGQEGDFHAEALPIKPFETLRETSFLGVRALVPDPPEDVLEAIYGNWRTPVRNYDSQNDSKTRLRIDAGDPYPTFPG